MITVSRDDYLRDIRESLAEFDRGLRRRTGLPTRTRAQLHHALAVDAEAAAVEARKHGIEIDFEGRPDGE